MELKRIDPGMKERPPVLLLIVPYGIETLVARLADAQIQAFNRTLWN